MRMLKLDFLSNNSGQTIIEILIAIGVGALVLTAISASAVITISNAQYAQRKTEALKYLQQGVENVRIDRDTNTWIDFISLSWPPETKTSANQTFTITTSVEDDPEDPENENKRQVTVTVSWDDARGTHEVSSVTKLSQW